MLLTEGQVSDYKGAATILPALPASARTLIGGNGSGYIATETKKLARDVGFEPRFTPVRSLQSNGMAEVFATTIKRDYARPSSLPDTRSVIEQLGLPPENWTSFQGADQQFASRSMVHRYGIPIENLLLKHSGRAVPL